MIMLGAVTLLLSLAPGAAIADETYPTGRADPRLTSFDAMMERFLSEHDVPGAVLSVSRNGRLVYSRGFGLADRKSKQVMQPDSLFRIASLSKPITSAVVFQLVQAGLIKLDDPVLEHLDPALLRGEMPVDKRWADITIRRLLQHTAGFDRDESEDPMFLARRIAEAFETSTPADTRLIISYMFSRPLDFTPGERVAYSNFGYALLGRVIERVTGENYETAVRNRLLAPLGISTMRIGGTFETDRFEGEVRYHARRKRASVFADNEGEFVPAAYGSWNHPSLDAHGGWVGSAPDLLRFAHLFRNVSDQSPLTVESIAETFAPPDILGGVSPSAPVWYGCGWNVRRVGPNLRNTWHTGYLPGCEALLVRRHDDLCWVIMFNSNADENLANGIDPLVHEAAKLVQAWPEFDLYTLGDGDRPRNEKAGDSK